MEKAKEHSTTEKKLIAEIIKTTGRAINRYGLIGRGDRVAVGISGGKDSCVLLEALALRRRHLPIDYELHAVYVDITTVPYEADLNFLENFCHSLSVGFTAITSHAETGDPGKETPCFLCSRSRRKELFDFCEREGYAKLALGHHRDDIIETFIMNMIYQGSLSSIPPRLGIFGGKLEIIRPLSLLPEEKIRRYAMIRSFPPQKRECPYGDDTKRKAVKDMIDKMEKLHGDARSSIFRSMQNVHREYLL